MPNILSRSRYPTMEEIEEWAWIVRTEPESFLAKQIMKWRKKTWTLCWCVVLLNAWLVGGFLGCLVRVFITHREMLWCWWFLPVDLVLMFLTGWMGFQVFSVDQKFRRLGL